MKFALVSRSLPPSLTGQAMMIYRLLKGLDPCSYCLLSTENYDIEDSSINYTPKLPAKYYYLAEGYQIVRGYRLGLAKMREFLNVALSIVSRGLQIAKILKRERCDAIIACTDELLDLPEIGRAS